MKMEIHVLTEFTMTLFAFAPNWKPLHCPFTVKWMDKLGETVPRILPHGRRAANADKHTWMDLSALCQGHQVTCWVVTPWGWGLYRTKQQSVEEGVCDSIHVTF